MVHALASEGLQFLGDLFFESSEEMAWCPDKAFLFCSLGLLVRRVHWEQAERILESLCTRLVSSKKEQDREIASIALKTVVNEITGPELSVLVAKNVVPKLLLGMQSKVAFSSPSPCA